MLSTNTIQIPYEFIPQLLTVTLHMNFISALGCDKILHLWQGEVENNKGRKYSLFPDSTLWQESDIQSLFCSKGRWSQIEHKVNAFFPPKITLWLGYFHLDRNNVKGFQYFYLKKKKIINIYITSYLPQLGKKKSTLKCSNTFFSNSNILASVNLFLIWWAFLSA